MSNRIRRTAYVLFIFGTLCLIFCILLFVLGGGFINSAVKKGCELREGTPAYENWRNPPVPLTISFYVFHLNDTEFLNGTKVPSVKQRGPFVYKEVRSKNTVEEYVNGTLSYHEDRNYTFDRSRSCDVCDEETFNITTINIVYMALVNLLQADHVPDIFRDMIAQIIANDEKPTMQRTVKEFLWGYTDPLLEKLKDAFPDIIASDQVSVFNASVSAAGLNTFLINSGVNLHGNDSNRIKQVGNIERYNFEESVPYWSNQYANMINGTDSTLWHPDTKDTDEVYIFSSDICRSLRLEFSEPQTNRFNIGTKRFILPTTAFANSPDNEGFCLNSTTSNKLRDLHCLPNGLMSLKTCIKLSGSSVSVPLPIIASSPHFLDAAPAVQHAVQGLQPEGSLHRSFMDVEPITGTVMNGSRRMQINLSVINDSAIDPIAHVKPFVYPMMWLDEHAEIDDVRANEFHSKVTTPMTILTVVKYLSLVIGVICFIIPTILLIRNHYKEKTIGPAFPTSNADETSPLLI